MPPAKRTTGTTRATAAKAEETKADDTATKPEESTADAKTDDKVEAKGQQGADAKKASEKREQDPKDFANKGRTANHDPVVANSHDQASHAMEADQGKLRAAVPVQVSNFDNSDLSRNVLDSMSHTADDKGSDKSK